MISSSPQHRPGGILEMLAIAAPMVISSACDTAMNFTDRLFISTMGMEKMNAVMSGGLTVFVLMSFTIGLTGYSTALIAQYFGSERRDRCSIVVTQGLIIALLSYPIILSLRPIIHWSFEAMALPALQLEAQIVYFDILCYGSIFGLVRHVISGFFSGIGRTRIVMVAALVAVVVNIISSYAMIFGHWGCPPLGIRGAAYGSILGGGASCIVLLGAYLAPKTRVQYGVFKSLSYDAKAMKLLFRHGLPGGAEMLLNLIAFDLLILTFQGHDVVTGSAITIVFNWDMVSFVPLLGVHIGVTSLVGRYMGAGDPDTAHLATCSGLKVGYTYAGIMTLIFAFFPELMVGVFVNPDSPNSLEISALSVNMLRLASLYLLADATSLTFGGALRGAGDTLWAMLISVAMHWTLVPLLLVLLYILHWPPVWVWGGLVVTIFIFSAFMYLRYRSGRWRKIRVVDTAPSSLLIPAGTDL